MTEQLQFLLMAAVVGFLASLPGLLLTYSQRKITNAANRADAAVDTIALATKREEFILTVAGKTDEARTEAQKSRAAAEEAVRAAKTADDKVSGLETKVVELEKSGDAKDNQIKTLEERVEGLERQQIVKQGELDKKDGIIAERDAYIKDLTRQLVEYAAKSPSSVPAAQQPAPLAGVPGAPAVGTPANPLQMEISNKDDNPVPTTDMGGASEPDSHAQANREQQARAAAELSRRGGVIAPPDANEPAA